METTMYELLGLVKDGKTPKRIIYEQYVYVWNKEDGNYTRETDIGTSLNWDYIVVNCLNDPVEILNKSIEEKKIPEKLTPFEAPFLKNDLIHQLSKTLDEYEVYLERLNAARHYIDKYFLQHQGDETINVNVLEYIKEILEGRSLF